MTDNHLNTNKLLKDCVVYDWGKIQYKEAWDKQTILANELIAAKKQSDFPVNEHPYKLIFCEHNPVYTLGKSGSIEHIKLSDKELSERGIEFYKINRGGDITYHGPGQLVCYPIFDLERISRDLKRYISSLEEVVIRTLAAYEIFGIRIPEYTGVWLEATEVLPLRKICAIGVHMSRWVSMHGFAFNINTDLAYFRNIIPCGINDSNKAVTSLAIELGKEIDMNHVKKQLLFHFSEVFGLKYAKEDAKIHL